MSQALIAARVLLGVVFIRSGYLKAKSPDAFRSMVRALTFLSVRQRRWISAGFPVVEIALGLWLLSGFLATGAAGMAVLLVIIMTLATSWLAGSVTAGMSCGCGGAGAETTPGPALVARNSVLMGVATFPLVFSIWQAPDPSAWQRLGSSVGWLQGSLVVTALVALGWCCLHLVVAASDLFGGSNGSHRHTHVGAGRAR